MEPEQGSHGTLVDLLERALDRGLVLNADVIISVAGVPLIGAKLFLALAGIDTMLDYGMFQDWSEAQRIAQRDANRPTKTEENYPLLQNSLEGRRDH